MPGNQTGDDVSVDRAKLEAVVRIETDPCVYRKLYPC